MLKSSFLFCCLVGIFCQVSSQRRRAMTNEIPNRIDRRTRCHGVDYPGLGCFSLDPPFTNTNWLPQRPSFVNTGFLLYTRANPIVPDMLHHDVRSSISSSHFNANLPVKILIHGFLQYGRMDFLKNMTRALLDSANMNVIVVNWGGGAGFPYTQAVANTRLVGAETAVLINTLSTVTAMTPGQVHLVGHSLGAHIAGYAGARVPGLGRITALDPAQPNYQGFDKDVRLDKTDARFVDVIHTDGVPYDTVRGYGMTEPVGHVDFYPNGGHDQPNCHEESSVLGFFEDAFSRGMTNAEVGLSCSHERSTELFTASVILSTTSSPSHCTFSAFPCDSEESFLKGECLHCGNRPCPIMGLEADKSFRSRGIFFLNTTGTQPFCGHHYFVSLALDTGMTYTDGEVRVKLTGALGNTDWTTVKSGRMTGGDVITKLMLHDLDIGEVTKVQVLFVHDAGYFSWTNSFLTLKRIEVNSIMKFPTKYFCGANMDVHDHSQLSLDRGTFTQSDC